VSSRRREPCRQRIGLRVGKVSVYCRVTRPWDALCLGQCMVHGCVALAERCCGRTRGETSRLTSEEDAP
jgi:hypothetical protein